MSEGLSTDTLVTTLADHLRNLLVIRTCGADSDLVEVPGMSIEELATQARHRLGRQGYSHIEFKLGNGYHGWTEHAPFDKIIVTAAPELIPPALVHQMKPGAKMVVPAGLADAQQLILVQKDQNSRLSTHELLPVRFSQLEGVDEDPLRGS